MIQEPKKVFPRILAMFAVLLICSSIVFAAGVNYDKIQNPLSGTNSLGDFFNGIATVCIELGTIISVLAIMYGGFLYVTAQGNEEKLGTAYKTITWALVGTAVLLGARTIMAVVKSTVTDLAS